MVLLVHGGPWARDGWGLNVTHQWLANRGDAVLSVNYRGSTGFGQAFVNAANLEWAGRMHDDLIDAVDWAGARGIADPRRVAIYGACYGGYAALVGATFTPEVFACAVDLSKPSWPSTSGPPRARRHRLRRVHHRVQGRPRPRRSLISPSALRGGRAP